MIPPRIRFRSIGKTYPGVRALDHVSFDVAPGSIHALVGENGAGKSTLIKILAGATAPGSGEIELDGMPIAIRDAGHGRELGIAVVYQEFNLARDLSVAENIFLGRWPRRRLGLAIDFPKLHRDASAVLATLGIDLPAARPVAGLSVAQQQMIEIAKALACAARVLVLDEPSAVLTPHELTTLFRMIADARDRGVSVLYISHRLEEVFAIADTVTVLRDGRHIATTPVAGVTRGGLIHDMVGRPLTKEFPHRESAPGPAAVRVQNLSARGHFANVTFDLRAGEVFGLTGLVGSGRTSVARAIFGDLRASAGCVSVGEVRGPFRNPRQALSAGMMLLPEDRKQSGLLLERPLRENITLASRGDVATAGLISIRREREAASRHMGDLGIRAPGPDVRAGALSGGNQQKVLFARCLARRVRILLLDEPTRGVDVGGKYEIYMFINSLVAQAAAVMMISSELPEVIGMCDRIGVMHAGRLAGILDNRHRSVTQEQIMHLATGERPTLPV